MNILKVDNSIALNSIDDLKAYYESIRFKIELRMRQFEQVSSSHLFTELVFCILTANTSAKMSLKAIDVLGSKILDSSQDDIAQALKGTYRFINIRANYIVRSRCFLQENYDLDIGKIINKYDDLYELRDYLKENIVGIGYKECSHFLRNIGLKGFAILDKHIIAMLNVFGCGVFKPGSKKEYKEIELKMKHFAKQVNIDFDHLDLVFWSYKTGEIIK